MQCGSAVVQKLEFLAGDSSRLIKRVTVLESMSPETTAVCLFEPLSLSRCRVGRPLADKYCDLDCNAGVHVWSTDLIGGHIGMLIDNSNGAGSNREIFITHATMDSNWRGLAVADDAYVSIVGCWTASSDQDNIWVSPESTGAQLVISGGTIFNAGAGGGDPSKDMCNGATFNAGTFQITGTDIRNNNGRGVWVPNDTVQNYAISGCRIASNGQGLELAGSAYAVTSNVFSGNANQSHFGTQSDGAIVTSNVNPNS